MKFRAFILSVVVGLFFIIPASYAQAPTTESRPFHQVEDAMADIDQTLALAREGNKLALIVLGANWCHDSRGLAERLASDEMSELLEEGYELLYVDIGFYESNMGLVKRFGLPIMFGTPTVLVINPHTEQLLNGGSMHQWLDASKISLEDTKAHFTQLLLLDVEIDVANHEQSTQLIALLSDISTYEAEQTARITRGYAIIGPMLDKRVTENEQSDEFLSYWGQLSKMRYVLANALVALRQAAIARDAAGETDIVLEYPEFEPLSWE